MRDRTAWREAWAEYEQAQPAFWEALKERSVFAGIEESASGAAHPTADPRVITLVPRTAVARTARGLAICCVLLRQREAEARYDAAVRRVLSVKPPDYQAFAYKLLALSGFDQARRWMEAPEGSLAADLREPGSFSTVALQQLCNEAWETMKSQLVGQLDLSRSLLSDAVADRPSPGAA
jgi:hypothetical protein